MASDLDFVEFVVDQCDDELEVSFKRMFGEYGLYSGETFIGVICDNGLFVKPTDGGRVFIDDLVEAPAYPGAKPSFSIGDRVEDGGWLSELIRITAGELRGSGP